MEQAENQPDQHCQHCGTALTSETSGGLCPRCLLEMNFASRTMPGGEPSPQLPPPSPEEIADRFPQFEILECLGRGGMGIVYKARQKALDRLVAIKVLAGERNDDPQFEARFSREARTLAKLSHSNIVTVHDFGESDGMFYLVMEFIDGVNLRDVLRDGRMEPAQALAIVPEICEALQFAHDHEVVHRDIKPENILMDRDGRVKIADFGIATLVGAAAERSGTPPYMAPEQEAAEGAIDHRADIYALGVVFYEMLTGERPEQDPSRPSQRVEIDVRLDEIVLRALEKEPEQRYQTAGEFRTMVETITAPAGAPGAKLPPAVEEGETPGVRSTGNPRFSRLAIWGAVWASFIVGLLPALLSQSVPAEQHAGPEWWQILLMVTLLPLGLTAPFGTTILGWVSVSQIRRSAGRLYGLGLAVFDGLFFPLLVLDGVMFWAGSELVDVVARMSMNEGPGGSSMQFGATGPIALLVIIVDFLIVRAVWRAVNKPLEGSRAIPPKPPESETSASQSEASFRNPTDRNDRNRWELTIVVAGTLFFVLFSVFAWEWSGPFRVLLIAISALGLAICALSLAGVWPFPSPIFPEPNFSSRNMGRRWLRVSVFGVMALAVVLTALLFWLQRPRPWDSRTLSGESYDEMFTASGRTWYAKRIFGDDRTFYRFEVDGLGGSVVERWEVMIPYEKLATNSARPPRHKISFSNKGGVFWAHDSKRVSFQVNGIEVAGFDTETGKPTEPGKPTEVGGELAARERVARGFLKAMLRGDVEGTRALLAPLSPLPHVVDLEEWVAEAPSALHEEFGGEVWRLTTFTEWLSDGDWAVARTTSMPDDSKSGLYVVLQRSNQGWGVFCVETAENGVPLRHYLDQAQPFGEASVETDATGAPGATPEGTLQEYTEAVLSGDVEKALSHLAPPLSETGEEIAKAILLAQVRRREGAERMVIVEWHKEGVYAVARYRSPPEAIRAQMPIKPYVILERAGTVWKVVWTSVSRSEGSLANELSIFRRFRLVDRRDPKVVAQAFIGAVRNGDPDMALMLSGFPMSGNPGELASEFARVDREKPGSDPVVPSGWHEEGDYAVTRAKLLADRPELETCLVLKRTGRIWRVMWADASGPEASLADNLERFKKEVLVGRVMVEDLALRFLVAIREKDEMTLRELCVDRTEGWTEALVGQFSMELRERFRQLTGEEFTLYPGTLQVDWKRKEKDFAVVRCLAEREVQGKLEGNILVLHFCRTGDGWKVWTARKAPESQTLDEHLAQAREWAAEWEAAPSGDDGSADAEQTPEQVAVAFMDAMRNGDIDAVMACMSTEMKVLEELRKWLEQCSGQLVNGYAGELARLTEFTEWYPEKRDADTRFIGTRIAGVSGKNDPGVKGGLYLILSPTPEGWKVAHFDDARPDKPLSHYVDRIVRIIPGEGPEFRGATAELPEMAPDHAERVVRSVQLPDADRKDVPTVLDLAGGELLDVPMEGEEEIINYFNKLGRGDLAWDHALITLRGAKVNEWNDGVWDQLVPEREKMGCATYRFELPKRVRVTTAEGIPYTVNVRAGIKDGVRIEFQRGNVAPEVGDRAPAATPDRVPVNDERENAVKRAQALPVTAPAAMPKDSPLTVEQLQKVLEGVTWGEFIAAFADDGRGEEVSWKEAVSEGGSGMRFEATFPIGGEEMVLDLEVDPEFKGAIPSRLRSAENPDQILADPAEFLPQMATRYAVQSNHPAAAPAVAKLRERALQVKALSTMREYATAIALCKADTGTLPPTLETLVEKKYLRETTLMMNHETGKMEPPLYHGRPNHRVENLDGSKFILLAAPSAAQCGKRVVGFLDLSVKAIDEADYQAQLKAQ